MSLPKIIRLSKKVWRLWPQKDFGIREDKYIMEKVRVLLNMTCLLVFIYASTKYYQNISNHILKKFRLEIHSGELQTTTSEAVLVACGLLTSPYLCLFKIFQTIKKSLTAQEFGLEIYSVECTRKRTK